MTTFVFIPGAGSDSWHWHLVGRELRRRGYQVVTVDLPCDDDSAGLTEYTKTVVDAIGDRTGVILVAHSFGGFTAPLVCERVPVKVLVLVTAMIPVPGESAGEWWVNTDHTRAMSEEDERRGWVPEDIIDRFLHDVEPALAAEAIRRSRNQSGTPFEQPWPLKVWPRVTTRFLVCRDDRFFPPEFMRDLVRERLGIIPEEMDGGHAVALSRPMELVNRLVEFARPAPDAR